MKWLLVPILAGILACSPMDLVKHFTGGGGPDVTPVHVKE